MTIGDIKRRLLMYLQQASIDAEFLKDSEDMLIDALNDARLQAEQVYAFEHNKRVVSYPAVMGVFNWTSAVDAETPSITYSIRNLKKVWVVGDGGILSELPIEYRNLVPQNLTPFENSKLTLVGPKAYVNPANTIATNLVADAYIFLPNYTSDTDTDWIVEHGSNYLFWCALFHLNHVVKEFVPRQEGNLDIAESVIERQLAKLIALDNTRKHGADTLVDE